MEIIIFRIKLRIKTKAFLLGFTTLMSFASTCAIGLLQRSSSETILFICGTPRMTNIVTVYFYTDTVRTPNGAHKTNALKMSVSAKVGVKKG